MSKEIRFRSKLNSEIRAKSATKNNVLLDRDNELPSIQDATNASDFTTGIQEPGTKFDIGMHVRF